jgi:hypothetical protein
MRKSIAMTALATTVLLLAGCKNPPETPVANDTVEPAPAPEPDVNTVVDGNMTENGAMATPPEPTTDGSDDRVAGD